MIEGSDRLPELNGGPKTPPQPIPLNDLARIDSALGMAITEAVSRVVRSGWYSLGPEVEAFEHELAHYVGVGYAVGVASGSDALELSLRALGCGPGDEVITVANAGAYTTVAALAVGAEPRFADVEPHNLLITPTSVEARISNRTNAIVVTHLFGHLADVEAIARICKRAGVALVEDCAQAIGAEYGGRRAGSFGDLAAFSFYPTKNLGAIGDGGAVVTSDSRIAAEVRSLRQYGWDHRYSISRPGGRNSRLDEIQAAVLRTKLPALTRWNQRRRDIVARYRVAVDPGVGTFTGSDARDDVAHLAVLKAAHDRNRLRDRLHARGISTDIHYPTPDHHQPGFTETLTSTHLPVTEQAAQDICTVPCFPTLSDQEISRICAALSDGRGDCGTR